MGLKCQPAHTHCGYRLIDPCVAWISSQRQITQAGTNFDDKVIASLCSNQIDRKDVYMCRMPRGARPSSPPQLLIKCRQFRTMKRTLTHVLTIRCRLISPVSNQPALSLYVFYHWSVVKFQTTGETNFRRRFRTLDDPRPNRARQSVPAIKIHFEAISSKYLILVQKDS